MTPEPETPETTAPETPEAPAESVETPETPATEAVEATEEKKEEFDAVEAILSGDKPQWMVDQEAILAHEGIDSFRVSEEEYDSLSPTQRRVLTNLRRMVDRKTSEASTQIKSLEEREETLKRKELELQINALGPLNTLLDPKLKEFAKAPEGEQPDPSTRAGQEWLAKQAVATQLAEYFAALQGVADERQAAADKAQTDATTTAWTDAGDTWIESLDESGKEAYSEAFPAMQELIAVYTDAKRPIPSVERVFKMVHGGSPPVEDKPVTRAEIRAAGRSPSRRRSTTVVLKPPSEMTNARDLALWHQNNGSLGTALEELSRGSGSSLG